MPVALQLLAEARRLATATAGQVEAIVFGLAALDPLTQLAAHGADRIHLFETDDANRYNPDAYAATLGRLGADKAPLMILFPATSRGTDLAGRIAAACRWPLFPRATDVRTHDGALQVTRALAAGKVHARLTPAVEGTCLLTVASDVIVADDPDPEREAVIVREQLAVPNTPLIEVRELLDGDPGTIDLTEAETVVSVGRGLGAAENVRLAEQLAEVLGGSVGATRVVVDLGWLPKARQVGQTGKTVRPRLYVACGLSGATQHTMGMKQSDTVIAINTDPVAPIFKIADLAVTMDAVTLLPLLVEKCRRSRGET